MESEHCGEARLGRTVRRQRLAIAGLVGAFALLVGVGQAERGKAAEVREYAAGGDRLYRVWDDGRIEYLIVDFAHGSVEGVPGWAPLQIDHSLSRDRMGNVTRR